ncbi:phosphoenolpyruvate--protein phosphotransferase [Crassaminicella profunda]|uniref:phosphoenolpyruvate--protein phosphotransferase n=1 Tax=Crassaminicella profunda TaxID=1286698 RepID=UPI001CA76DC7|nr:phosphoenolpyruvate--protein phosphotransferase [Crassaminicella profunda]QZY55232.1 phosphoenolpyruvate--protein phosphotransferase [Crassaminicella profunda]
MFNGIGASPGIAMGKILLKKEAKIEIVKKDVKDPIAEVHALHDARVKSKDEILKLYEHTLETIGKKEAQIFEAHSMIVEDIEIFNQIESKIKDEKVNAEWALKEVTDMFIDMFANMDDEYMKERASDIKDVTNRIIRNLLGIEDIDLSNLKEPAIIVAEDLTPSDTASMDKKNVLGFVTAVGGRTAHSAIMARSLEIPAVVGTSDILSKVNNGDYMVFDGDEGIIYLNPSQDITDRYAEKLEKNKIFKNTLQKLIGKESITLDGKKVELAANIGTVNDLEGVLRNDAQGIGLFRTEFLYMDRTNLPSEEEQFEVYKKVAQTMKEKPVVIRTLDIGGDKDLSYMDLPKEMNPFLGYRAIRLCLDQVDIFKTQLRALLKASSYGNIKIMFPMISCMEELKEAKCILESVKNDLKNENIVFNENIEVGMMIEVPAAAIISDMLAKEVDFFSIGTNDLIQYTVAVDRGNQKLSYIYNQFNPAVLRLIQLVIDNGHKEGIWVGMCGEVAGDPEMIPILAGMGLDEFSMSPTSILKARYILKNVDTQKIAELLDELLWISTASEVQTYIKKKISSIL